MVSHEHEHEHGHGHGHGHRGGLVGVLTHLVVPHSHDTSAMASAVEADGRGIRAVRIGLIGLGVTAVLQLIVVVISGSVALLADTIHNFSDALTAVPLGIAFVLGRRPATRRYTYGLGRVEDLAGLFVVAMIALSAVVAGYESIRRLGHPPQLHGLGWVLAAGLIGFVGNELVAAYRVRVGRSIGSAALVADGIHARTDGFTSLAVVLGVIGVWLGFPLADPIIGLLISIAIAVLLVGTTREIGRRLLDGVDPALSDTVRTVLAGLPEVEGVTDLRMRWVGHRLSVDATVGTDPGLTVAGFGMLARRADGAARAAVPTIGRVRLSPAGQPGNVTLNAAKTPESAAGDR